MKIVAYELRWDSARRGEDDWDILLDERVERDGLPGSAVTSLEVLRGRALANLASLDLAANPQYLPIVSRRAFDALMGDEPACASAIPLDLHGPEGEVAFVLLHVESYVDAFDSKASSWTESELFEGEVGLIEDLVLTPGSYPEVFRIRENPAVLLVGKAARDRLESTGAAAGFAWKPIRTS